MIRKEMSKDNVMLVVALVAGLTMCVLSRQHEKEIEKDWKLYIAHDYDEAFRSRAK